MITRIQDHFIVFIKKKKRERDFYKGFSPWLSQCSAQRQMSGTFCDCWEAAQVKWRGPGCKSAQDDKWSNWRISSCITQVSKKYKIYRHHTLSNRNGMYEHELAFNYDIIKDHGIRHPKACIAAPHLSSSVVWDADELEEGWGRRTRHSCQCWQNWTSSGSWGCNHRSLWWWEGRKKPWRRTTHPHSSELVPCLNVAEEKQAQNHQIIPVS